MIYPILVHIHSGLRWLVLAALLLAILTALLKKLGQRKYTCTDCGFNKISMMLVHAQLLVGLVLYFISPKVVFDAASMKVGLLRFFLVEHLLLMLIAIALITIGYVKADRAGDDSRKHRHILIYYTIGLVLILASIPWPFLNYDGSWF
jgi:hypothetical protein